VVLRGLSNLEQRAAKLGGTLRIQPAAGGGTELDWRVPLAAAANPMPG
jgi:signal transduction histidine kinase